MIEITTIGAGAGPLLLVDKGGLLQVGPESGGLRPRSGLLRARQ
jgi:N-methylhydantoinase A